LPKVSGDGLAKLNKPASDSFIGNIQTAHREEIFDIAITQSEPEVEPDSVLYDDRGETMAAIGYFVHLRRILPQRSRRHIQFP